MKKLHLIILVLLSNFLVASCTTEELPDDIKEQDIYSTEGEEEPNDPGEDFPADGN